MKNVCALVLCLLAFNVLAQKDNKEGRGGRGDDGERSEREDRDEKDNRDEKDRNKSAQLPIKPSVIPVKCIFIGKTKIRKEEACSEFNPLDPKSGGKKMDNVCIYDDGWKIGKWNNSKSGKKRFIPRQQCTLGVEVYTDSEEGLVAAGPRKFSAAEVNKNKQVFTSLVSASPVPGTPSACFLSQSTRGKSEKAISCESEPTKTGYCEFIETSDKHYVGKWWVRYTRENKQKPVVCTGGVAFFDPK